MLPDPAQNPHNSWVVAVVWLVDFVCLFLNEALIFKPSSCQASTPPQDYFLGPVIKGRQQGSEQLLWPVPNGPSEICGGVVRTGPWISAEA